MITSYSHCIRSHSRLVPLLDPLAPLLTLPRSTYAAYNAASSTPRNACTKNTREIILAGLVTWAAEPKNKKIYWLSGMAGTGKTTIAYSFSEILDQIGMLGGTFFCSRSQDECRNVDRIFPTIAYELARRFPSVRHALLEVLKRDPDSGTRRMELQFLDLIVSPVKVATEDLTKRSVVVVIDALDECADQSKVEMMLSIISQHLPHLPIKFLVTSRPERHIRETFSGPDFTDSSKFYLQC